jgi:futalosine hydrolase
VNHRITVVVATPGEIEPFLHYLQKNAEQHSFQTFQLHTLLIDILYTGIGIMDTMYTLMDYISHRHPDGWIQAGIGGALDTSLSISQVYSISSETLVGFGAEEQNGIIRDPFQLGWSDPDAFPYESGLMLCPHHLQPGLPIATGMTSFHSHGDASRIELIHLGTSGQIESMEGAPFFYISLMKKIPFLSLRAISNFVEPRDVSKWQIKPAIDQLNTALIKWLETENFNVDRLFGIGDH